MTETVPYKETGRIGEVEFRQYPALLLATVEGLDDNEAFMVLFRYISGNNRPGRQVPMTAPVITPEKITMTAPVISGRTGMSFILPAMYKRDEVPEPLDPRALIGEVPPREVALIRFSGRASPGDVKKIRDRLLDTLREKGIATEGEPFLMRYNAPFIPGFLRRNEVGVEVRRKNG